MILNYFNYFWIILQPIPLTANPHSTTYHLLGSNILLHSSTSRFLRLIPWNWTSKVNSMLRCSLLQKFLYTGNKWLIVRYFHLHPKPAKWSLNGRGYRSKVGSKIHFEEFLNLFRVNCWAKEGSSASTVTDWQAAICQNKSKITEKFINLRFTLFKF